MDTLKNFVLYILHFTLHSRIKVREDIIKNFVVIHDFIPIYVTSQTKNKNNFFLIRTIHLYGYPQVTAQLKK